mmetsp:Transcript_4924/g.9764  ORF Transcript_4924/g.9764 Transcript_4924/m.9764 type:complete len:203 (+) Transcript_4924:959-1567(+)
MADKHLKHNAPNAPLVDFVVVNAGAHYKLRSSIPQGEQLSVDPELPFALHCEAEIAHLCGAVIKNENVARLDVLVEHPLAVDKIHGRQHLLGPTLAQSEREPRAHLLDYVVYVARGHFHGKHATIVALCQNFNHVGVRSNAFHQDNLLLKCRHDVLVRHSAIRELTFKHRFLLQYFECNTLILCHPFCQQHLPERPLPQRPP